MDFRFPKAFVLVAGLMLTALAGCDEPGLTMAAQPVEAPVPPETHYAAQKDTRFTVPAVPYEKLPPEFQRQQVAYDTDQPAGTIVIDPASKYLYLITARHQAIRYGISVGKAGFGWSGEADITGRTTWPTWTPPPEMIVRRPELERYRHGQPGGLTNPLGARALYLKTDGVDYGYRIHGTPEWASIGHNASSGCIRMINQDVMDLYNRVPNGTHVVVLTEDGQFPDKLTVPKPVPKAARKPKPVVVRDPLEAVAPTEPQSGQI